MKTFHAGLAAVAVGAALAAVPAIAKDDDRGSHANKGQVTTRLSGYNEVHFVAGPPAALRGALSRLTITLLRASAGSSSPLNVPRTRS